MHRDSLVTARVNSHIKKEAEYILKQIGLNTSTAINLFYSNIIANKGLPFRLKLNSIPYASEEEQKDIEKILKKRTKADKKISNSKSIIISL